ncbi:MAG: tyrosine-type recombinase/integrase [Candidatus Babeliaceae bacterium]|nr:tyrosine-type recombinase/integrase [Candidatus Babeliaceae bacterium]
MAENLFIQFEQWLQTEDCSPLTVRSYLSALRAFVIWFEQTQDKVFEPILVTSLDVRTYRQHIQTVKRLAPATINRHLAALRTYMRWAQSTNLIEHNPLAGIKSVPSETPAPRWLERTEQRALIREAEQEMLLGDFCAGGDKTAPGYIWPRRDYALVMFLLNTGLRLAEVAALTLDDIEINERSGKVVVRQGKGGKFREVPMNATARSSVSEWLDVRPKSKSDSLFLSQKGGPLSMRGISSRISTLAKAAGLKDVSPHTLRHSFAKNLINAGVSLEKVAALLGHSSISVTQRYVTPSQVDLQIATEAVAWED